MWKCKTVQLHLCVCLFFDGKREHNSCPTHILSPIIFSDIISDLCSSQENLVYCHLMSCSRQQWCLGVWGYKSPCTQSGHLNLDIIHWKSVKNEKKYKLKTMSLILFNHRCHQTFGFQPPFAQQKVTEELWSGRSYFVCPRSRRKSAIHFSYTRLNSQTSNHCSLTCIFHRFTFKFCISFGWIQQPWHCFSSSLWQNDRQNVISQKTKLKQLKLKAIGCYNIWESVACLWPRRSRFIGRKIWNGNTGPY